MTAKDPVCGMTIEEGDAVATVDYEGKKYFFCSQDCADEFNNDPASYTS
ncbi:MAG: YHS domain-containing protein [Actinomycetota bacterium]